MEGALEKVPRSVQNDEEPEGDLIQMQGGDTYNQLYMYRLVYLCDNEGNDGGYVPPTNEKDPRRGRLKC